MKISLLSGENRSGAKLSSLLQKQDYRDFRFAVAYMRRSGVVVLESSLRKFVDGGNTAQGIVGVNQGNTSYQGLRLLTDIIGDGLHLRCGRKGGAVFHPKLYFFGKRAGEIAPLTAMIGSSNFTRGGFETNEECDILLENIPQDFSCAVGKCWDDMQITGERFATVRATPEILKALRDCGALIDETQTKKKSAATPVDIEAELSQILAASTQPHRRFFAMTLSHFDVSSRSADPVILIPIKARRIDEKFWFWPDFFVREKKLSSVRLESKVTIDGQTRSEQIRIYDYPGKNEFRLKSEAIKRNGAEGDILVVDRDRDNMALSLVRKADAKKHAKFGARLTESTPSKKKFGYFD